MFDKRKTKIIIFSCFLIMWVIAVGVNIYADQDHLLECMDVPLISKDEQGRFTEDLNFDIFELTFNGIKVAADSKSNTIYISQSPDDLSHYSTLHGALRTTNLMHTLYFVDNSAIKNIADSVCNGTPLTLIVVKGSSFRQVNVVITTLPVLSMEGTATTQKDAKGRQIIKGSLTLWSGFDPSTDRYNVNTCSTEWHVRGASSSSYPKKPWKLSLKDKSGGNYNCDFLGMGADDDWILNPMNLDDTKVREKFTMDLWNDFIYSSDNGYKMSTGEYVEVVINHEYQGLYLLQRRVDAKYLQIDQETDIIFKGYPTWSPATLQEGYEIIYSPFEYSTAYEILSDALCNQEYSNINLQNFIDVNLLLQFCATPDNTGYKNMFYVLHATHSGYQLYLVPWDTDMSMGTTWNDAFVYDYEQSMNSLPIRQEYSQMQEYYPQLDELISERWNELRENVCSESNIEQLLTDDIHTIQSSGAFDRDIASWGYHYGGNDTQDELLRWCLERLTWLDNCYTK